MTGNDTTPDRLRPPTISSGAPAVEVWEYFWIIRRKWLLILLTVAVGMGLTAFITLRLPKIYRATTTVRIETQAPQVLGHSVENVVEMGTGTFWSNVEYYETQYRIIESRDIASRVVKEFKLNEDPSFLRVSPERRAGFKPISVDKAVEEFHKVLTVQPIKDSRLVKIHFDSREPERARLLSNAVAKAYVDRNLETMLQSTVDAADWLSKQVDEARVKLTDSEQKLYEFKRDNDILSISLEDRQNIITAQITAAATPFVSRAEPAISPASLIPKASL